MEENIQKDKLRRADMSIREFNTQIAAADNDVAWTQELRRYHPSELHECKLMLWPPWDDGSEIA